MINFLDKHPLIDFGLDSAVNFLIDLKVSFDFGDIMPLKTIRFQEIDNLVGSQLEKAIFRVSDYILIPSEYQLLRLLYSVAE